MISYDIDPSLHTGEPKPPRLEDGFSPPQLGDDAAQGVASREKGAPQPAPLGDISPF